MLSNTEVNLLTKYKKLEDEVLEGQLLDYVSEHYMNKIKYYEKAYHKAYRDDNIRYFLSKLVYHGIYDHNIEELLINSIFER